MGQWEFILGILMCVFCTCIYHVQVSDAYSVGREHSVSGDLYQRQSKTQLIEETDEKLTRDTYRIQDSKIANRKSFKSASTTVDGVTYFNHKTPSVFYISYYGSVPTTASSETEVLIDVLSGDDFPFRRLPLPWQFNYFGVGLNNIYVSPNGALHASPLAPCPVCYCFWGGAKCNYNNSYYGVIAGFNSDLYPGKYEHASNITASTGEGSVTVQFKNVPFYYSEINNTFGMALFNDSSMQLFWNSVDANSSPPGEPLLVGFRNFFNNSLTVFTTSQSSTAYEFGYSVPGIYPSKGNVKSGYSFTACPISTVWCASPAVLDVDSLVAVSLTPLSISCLNSVTYALYVITSTAVPSNTVNLASDSSTVVACSKISEITLSCDISTLPSNYLVESNLTFGFAWRVTQPAYETTAEDYQQLTLVDPIRIRLGGSQSNTCSVNENVAYCGSSCTLCSGNYSCLELPCDNSTNAVLYKYPVCNNTCYGTHNYKDLYYDVDNDVCCNETQMDCLGTCFGTRVSAPNTIGSYSCCEADELDCEGVCGGSVINDACGVCGGTDYTGQSCKNGISVQTNTPVPNSLNADVYAMNSTIFAINVSNTNSSSITVTLVIGDDVTANSYAPAITFLTRSAEVPGYSSTIFYVNVSVSGLISGQLSNWMVKQINVESVRDGVDKLYIYRIYVYPAVMDCDTIQTYQTCEILPACIFCDDYDYIRILRETPSGNSRRRLFPNLLPDQLINGEDYISGGCHNGWNRTVCTEPSFSTSAGVSQRSYRKYLFWIVSIVSTVSMFVLQYL